MTAAKRYAIENGYDHCRHYRNWLNWRVYVAYNGKARPTGAPTFIMDDGFECRFANDDEIKDVMSGRMAYRKNHKKDVIYWVDNCDFIGCHLFSFDKRKIYNLFRDYPYNLTAEQKEIFDRENPYWRDFFADRQ